MLIDTHILLWWTTGYTPRGKTERAAMTAFRGRAGRDVSVSVVSLWEVAAKQRRGNLDLGRSLNLWLEMVVDNPIIEVLPLDVPVMRCSQLRLPDTMHEDPADRFIVATAIERRLKLLTADEKIVRGLAEVEGVLADLADGVA